MRKRWRLGLLVLACCALVGLMVVATPGTPGGEKALAPAPAPEKAGPAKKPAAKKVTAPLAQAQPASEVGPAQARFANPEPAKTARVADFASRIKQTKVAGIVPEAEGAGLDPALKVVRGPHAAEPEVTTNIADGLQAGEGWAIPDPDYIPGERGKMPDSIDESERAERDKIAAVSTQFDDGTVAQGADQLPPANLQPIDVLSASGRDEAAPGAATTPVNVRDYPRNTTSPWNTTCAGGAPPDVDMTAGVDWVITNVNSYFMVYNKAGTRQFAAPYESIAASAGLGQCGGTTSGWWSCDPQTLYDDENDRYVLIWLATNGSDSRQCIAVTKTNDPRSSGTANWWCYSYDPAGSTTLDDYPHAGIGQDAIFVGVNRFVGGSFSTSALVAFNKTKAYAGTLAAVAGTDYVDANIAGYATPQPAERRGFGQGQYPPAGTRHFICATNTGTGGLNIWGWNIPTMSNTPATWATAVLGSPGTGSTPSAAAITSQPVDNLSDRYMDCEVRWPYLYTARTGADTSATYNTIQWAQINVSGGTPSVTNSNEYTRVANSSYNWMPDVTSDKQHNMAIAHTFADDTGPVFIGGYIAGREFTDAANTMLDGGAVVAGGKVYNCGYLQNGSYRWGDYTGCAADPDGCTIWVHTEFVENNACTYCDATQLRNYKFASCSVTNGLFINDSRYTCADTLTVTVQDITTHNAAYYETQIGIASSAGDDERIVAANWTCTENCAGGNGTKWVGTLPIGPGAVSDYSGTLNVANGQTFSVTYTDTDSGHPDPVRTASIDCSAELTDGGYLIYGGCDNDLPYTPPATAVEMYNKYMDAGEYPTYTFGIFNAESFDLTDVVATLSVSGAGASYVTIYNPTVDVGGIAAGTVSGAVFNLSISPTCPNLTSVNMDLTVTSTADGLTTATNLTQAQVLEADDVITTQHTCWIHNSADMTTSTLSGYVANPWTNGNSFLGETITTNSWYGAAINCGNATAQSYATATNASKSTNNYAANAFQAVIGNAQPPLRGNGPTGQPYNYRWLQHGFYTANEVNQNTMGVWGCFYNDQWNSATAPTADAVYGFPISVAWYLHSTFDWSGTNTTDGLTAAGWDSTNTGTPDSLVASPANPANQLIITFGDVGGAATAGTYFALGHFHVDGALFGLAGTRADIAVDNDHLIYHEYYAGNDATTCGAGAQVGQVSFDAYRYNNCPTSTATLQVIDDNAVAPFYVTVTSASGADSELVVMNGTAPYFTGTLTLSSVTGVGANNGTLYCLSSDDILTASYTDTSPAGTSEAFASFYCTGGDVVYVSNTQVSDNGDNDGIADNNETVNLDITIRNDMATALANTVVTISTSSPNIDCIIDPTANYGTVGAGATATSSVADRFQFHVAPAVACSNWQAPPTATFVVTITGTGFNGSSSLQQFALNLDLDNSAGGTYTYTQAFSSDLGWTTGVTADEDGTCSGYVNNFAYRPDGHAAGNGCYGAWLGVGGTIGATGTTTGLPIYDSSTLYSPILTAAGNVTLTQDVAYRASATYCGAKVQSSVNSGAWTNVNFTSPAQVAITTNATYCYPGDNSPADSVWNSTAGQNWATTNAATVTATNGQTVQFRWRIGIDSTGGSARAASGFGVDNISITNLRQTIICEPTRNTGLPGSGPPAAPGAPTFASITQTSLTVNWSAVSGATSYDVWRRQGANCTYAVKINASPVVGTSYPDSGLTCALQYSYFIVARNSCGTSGNGTCATTTTSSCGGGNPPATPNNGDVPGTPLTLVKNTGTPANVDVAWDSTCTNDTDYRILWGLVSSLSLVSNVTNGTVDSATCSLGVSGTATNQTSPSPTPGQCYFAVIDAVNGTNFGRHGNNSAGNERVFSGDTSFCGASVKNTTATTCN